MRGAATTEAEDLAELAVYLHLREVLPRVRLRGQMRILRSRIRLSDVSKRAGNKLEVPDVRKPTSRRDYC